MNPEILEQLLTARALNELNAETEQLLEAYLAEHPEHQPLADSIEQTASLGRMAVAVPLPETLPPLPSLQAVKYPSARWQAAKRWLSVAAGVVIGFSAGIAAVYVSQAEQAAKPAVKVALQEPQINDKPAVNSAHSIRAFWSAQAYRLSPEQRDAQMMSEDEQREYHEQTEKYRKRGLL